MSRFIDKIIVLSNDGLGDLTSKYEADQSVNLQEQENQVLYLDLDLDLPNINLFWIWDEKLMHLLFNSGIG
jgi:hypothetical protein